MRRTEALSRFWCYICQLATSWLPCAPMMASLSMCVYACGWVCCMCAWAFVLCFCLLPAHFYSQEIRIYDQWRGHVCDGPAAGLRGVGWRSPKEVHCETGLWNFQHLNRLSLFIYVEYFINLLEEECTWLYINNYHWHVEWNIPFSLIFKLICNIFQTFEFLEPSVARLARGLRITAKAQDLTWLIFIAKKTPKIMAYAFYMYHFVYFCINWSFSFASGLIEFTLLIAA